MSSDNNMSPVVQFFRQSIKTPHGRLKSPVATVSIIYHVKTTRTQLASRKNELAETQGVSAFDKDSGNDADVLTHEKMRKVST